MLIGIVDADLIGRKKHRFPNLVCEKISSYYKEMGSLVELVTDYDRLDCYDHVYVSKVFTDTPVPDWFNEYANKNKDRIHIGGTGFFFDQAPNLDPIIEHTMPDYKLYDAFISDKLKDGGRKAEYKFYTDYSIGFTTRGCFRKCGFCVNKKYDSVKMHSPLEEFVDHSRKKICLLDDNILGCGQWRNILNELISTGKPFRFHQGLDERLLTDEKCSMLFNAKYDGDYTFAFDNVSDYELIEKKLGMIRKHTDKRNIKFYVLVGYEGVGIDDVKNMFKRIKLLMKYRCLPYIMRFQGEHDVPWKRSAYKDVYVSVARWCNQPSFFKKTSFREFAELSQKYGSYAPLRGIQKIEAENPEVAKEYFDMKYDGDIG